MLDLHNLQGCLACTKDKANRQIQAMASLKELNLDLQEKWKESKEAGKVLVAKREIPVNDIKKYLLRMEDHLQDQTSGFKKRHRHRCWG